jgi:signal transduction histidine kinase
LGFSELIARGIENRSTTKILKDVESIHHSSQHLLHLINDILELSRIDAGRLTLNRKRILFEPLFNEIKAYNTGLLVNKPVRIIVTVEPNLPPLKADPVRLSQILNNLVSNAAKFTEEGAIYLRAFCDGEHICLEVEDTGIGISETDQQKIFERFSQVGKARSQPAGGTGLGLAITRHLVELHGGAIEVRSQPGQGSTFTVWLPVKRSKCRELHSVE